MTRQQIIWFNLFSLFLIVIVWLLPLTPYLLSCQPMLVFAVSFLVIFVPGINIIYLAEKVTRQNYQLPVFLSLAILSSLTIPPFFLAAVYQRLNFIDSFLVLSVYTPFLLIPFLYWSTIFILNRWYHPAPENLLLFPRVVFPAALFHPLSLAFFASFAALFFNLTRYSFLPVPDSYSWLIDFTKNFSINQLSLTTDYARRSFSALLATFFYLGRLDPYFTFKYFLPFLSLLILPPLWLAARLLSGRFWQFTFLFAAIFISPTIILEVTYIRQQVIFLIFLYFMVGLHLYAIHAKDNTIFYLLFILALFGTTIHPAFLIIILTNLVAWFFTHQTLTRRYQLLTLLGLTILFPLAQKATIINMFIRIYEQARASLVNVLIGHWNLNFPSHYINSDGYEMSWPGFIGVIKYYAYYAGPVSFIILIILTLWLFTRKSFRQSFLSQLHHVSASSIVLPYILFFFIAEIAPRFGHIAFLPERAWQYLSILSIFFLFLLIKDQPAIRLSRPLRSYLPPVLLISFALISFYGASYVNYLNQYSMPDYEFKAARWMADHLDNSSLVYSSSSKNIIRYHAQKNFIGLNDVMYNESNPVIIFDHLMSQMPLTPDVAANLTHVSIKLSEISDISSTAQTSLDQAILVRHPSPDTYQTIDTVVKTLQAALSEVSIANNAARTNRQAHVQSINQLPPLYIFYSTTHPKNPLSSRPYKSSFTVNQNISDFPALDHYPQYFSRVYTDDNNVIIWQVKVNTFLSS